MTILISAGHHPYRKGARYKEFHEYDETIVWASKVAQLLNGEALMVPPEVLRKKVAFINSIVDPVCVVEIHFNAVGEDLQDRVRGSETLHYPTSGEGRRLAAAIQERIREVFPPDRGVKEGWYRGDKNNGAIFLLKQTRCPAVIVEPEFMHHFNDIRTRRDAGCEAIAQGIKDYVAGR